MPCRLLFCPTFLADFISLPATLLLKYCPVWLSSTAATPPGFPLPQSGPRRCLHLRISEFYPQSKMQTDKAKYIEALKGLLMKRLTATVSGKVQKVGYRKRIIDIAIAFGIKGIVENLEDGRVRIIAEGDEEKLKWFETAIEIKNTLIQVASVERAYAPASGEFAGFGKIVAGDETDSRLDKGIEVMNKMLVAIIDVNQTLVDMNSNLGGKMDTLGDKMDIVGEKVDNLGGKMDIMLQKQDELIVEVKDMGQSQSEMLDEVKGINKRAENVWEKEIADMKSDIVQIKDAMRARGMI